MASNIKLTNQHGKTTTISSGSNTTDITLDATKLLYQVDTIADLRALTETPSTIYVTGYHTKDDNAFGSHFFKRIDTSGADNGGTIIVPTGVTTYHYALQYDGAVNAKWFGIKAGIVDISKFVNALKAAKYNHSMVRFDGVEYDFNNQTIDDAGSAIDYYSVVGDTTTIFSNIHSTNYFDTIKSKGITYKDCLQPLFMSNTVTTLDIVNNTFIGCTRSVYHNNTATSISNVIVRDNIFKDTIESDFVGCVLLHQSLTATNVLIENNSFTNIKTDSSGNDTLLLVQVGRDVSTVENYTNITIQNNIIDDCGKETVAFNPSGLSFGIVTIGEDNIQSNNIITNGKWLEPIYMKGNGNSQIGNKCHNNQHSGVTMKVISTSNISKNNLQDGNTVTGLCGVRAAIRMFGSGISINSQVDITYDGTDTQGGYCFQATPSTTIDGVLKVTGNFKGDRGFNITTDGDLYIDCNLKSSEYGINVLDSGDLNQVTVKGAISSSGNALYVGVPNKINVSDLTVVSDSYTGSPDNIADSVMFLNSVEHTKVENVSIHLTNLSSADTSLGYAVGLYAADGTNIVENLDIVADRPLTYCFYNFSSTGSGLFKYSGLTIVDNNATISVDRLLSDVGTKITQNSYVDGLLGNISASGRTVQDVIIDNNMMNFIATDNLAGHFNGTAVRSRVQNNKTE